MRTRDEVGKERRTNIWKDVAMAECGESPRRGRRSSMRLHRKEQARASPSPNIWQETEQPSLNPEPVTKRRFSSSASGSSQANAKATLCNRPIFLFQTATVSWGQSLRCDPLRCAGLHRRRFFVIVSEFVCMVSIETVKQEDRLTKVSLKSSNLHKKRIASIRGNEEYYSCTHL